MTVEVINMTAKQIVFTKPGIAELLDATVMDPKPGEVQVRLAWSSISSGTERANLVGEMQVSAYHVLDTVRFPRTMGYSSSGVVEKVGEGVSHVKAGDRVALSWSKHASLINMPAENVYPISDAISFEEAALLHIGIFPLAAIRKCRFEMGESAIVMGMGILGLFAVHLLKAAGAVPIIAVDPDPIKRDKAMACGADYAFDPFAPDFAAQVKAVTHGGVNVAIEVTGNGGALDGVLDCMAKFGRVALLGCTRHSDFTIDYYHKIHAPGITLIGAHTMARPHTESSHGWWTQPDDIKALMKLTEMGRIRFSSLIDEIHSPTDAPAVYRRLATEKTFPLVQFDWSELDEKG